MLKERARILVLLLFSYQKIITSATSCPIKVHTHFVILFGKRLIKMNGLLKNISLPYIFKSTQCKRLLLKGPVIPLQ